EDADQEDGQLPLLTGEPGSDGVDEQRSGEDAEQGEYGGDQGEEPGDRPRHLARLLLGAVRPQRRVHRDERPAEHSLAQQVLEEVGDLERRVVGVRRVRGAEEVAEDALPAEPREPAEQDPRRHQRRAAAARPPARGGRWSRRHGRRRLLTHAAEDISASGLAAAFRPAAADQPIGEHFTAALEAVLFSRWQSPTSCCGSTTARTGAAMFCGGADQGMVTFSLEPGCNVVFVVPVPIFTLPPGMSAKKSTSTPGRAGIAPPL